MHVLDLFNDKDRTFLEGMVNTEGEIVDFPGKRNVRSIGPKQPTDGEVVKLKTPPKPQTLSTKDLAMISDKALDAAYGYGRSVPGPNFGWLANMNSAMFAKRAIDSGVTDIEKISAEIHKGWATAAIGDYKNKLPISPPTPHETKLRRLRLAQVGYNELPEKEKEKDRVVARALLQALSGKEIPGGNDMTEGDVVPMPKREPGEPVVNVQPASVVPFSQFKDPGTRKLEMWKQKVRDRHPEYGNRIRFVSKDNGAVVSAEIPGVDRSFGVFDMATETGQVLDEVKQRLDPSCWKGYKKQGTKIKGGVRVNNCVPAESIAEGQSEGEATLAKIAASGDDGYEMIYDGLNGLLGTEAQIILQDMYDDVSREHRLHPDDDFEEIQSRMMDRIQDDYGQQGVAEGSKDSAPKMSKQERKLAQSALKGAKDMSATLGLVRDKDGVLRMPKNKEQGVAEGQELYGLRIGKLEEGYEDNPVVSAIINRILKQRPDLLKYGVDLVSDAVDEVADFVGRVDEIGTSDVSAWVAHVERIIKSSIKPMESGPKFPGYLKGTDSAKMSRKRMVGSADESIDLNEVSDETLINYLTKVHQDAMKHKSDPTKRSPEKASKSVGGFNRAFNKLDARPRKDDVAKAQELAPRVSEETFNPMDHKEYLRLADELHAKMMSASQRGDKEEFERLQAERDELDTRARKGLKENEKEGKPRIRKYTKMRPDGSKAVRYEVLDYRGMRIPGQGTEGFDDPKFAKEFYYRNYDKLQGPVEEQVQEEPIREVAGRYWCKNEKRWKNVE